MRKHVVGFAVFSLIVGSFVVFYAFVFPPLIPDIGESDTAEQNGRKGSTGSLRQGISHKVESVHFDLGSDKLISKIDVNWRGESPADLFVKIRLYSPHDLDIVVFDTLTDANLDGMGGVVWFSEEQIPYATRIERTQNLYASFEVSDRPFESEETTGASGPVLKEVLFVHGDRSIIQK